MQKGGENHPHFPSVGRDKTREIHATCMQLEREENPSEPCALPGDAFTVSLQSACLGVQLASRRAPGDRSAPAAASAAAAAAGSRRGTRAEGERERTARERREGRKRVITRGRCGPARLRFGGGAARRGTAAGPARAPVDPFWVSTPGRELGGFARKATRWPSCWQGVGAQGDPNSPKFGLCWIKENWVALEGIRHLVECSLSSQSTSRDHCPSPGGSELWSNKRTWAGCEILQRCLWRELAAGLALSARVAHADTENADQRSLTFSEKGFRNRGCTLLN